ncbi:major tail protein [Arthrobacter phage Caterpillar]|nr:major tail protein [Arthrobacter phage Caterpillar]
MASVTGYTAAKLLEIEQAAVVGGSVNNMGNLILATRNGTQLDAGNVRGLTGDVGPDRPLAAGLISIFGGTVPPSGWMICNGMAVSRTTYSELFAAIGTTYGAGDGTNTFNIPDFRGRVATGYDSAQDEFNNLGEKGGAKTHTLTIDEMPAHTHTVKGFKGTDNLDFDGIQGGFAASDYLTPYDQLTQSTGGGLPHNNLQPYNVVNYIISIGNAGIAPAPAENFVGRGTTAQRDSIFGIPGTDPTRVALANRKVIWFNTDNGWEESFYATEGKAGLTATPLKSPASSGWYPTGPGPMVLLEPPAASAHTGPEMVKSWGTPVRRRGGTNWFVSTDGKMIEFKQFGRYDVRAWTIQQAGTGASNFHLRLTAADGTTIVKNVDGNAFPLNSSLYTRVHSEMDDTIVEAGQKIGLYLHSGTLSLHVGSVAPRGQFLVRYLGPPLVME